MLYEGSIYTAENLELEVDSGGCFTLIASWSVNLRIVVHFTTLTISWCLRPSDCWKSEERIFRVVAKTSNDQPMLLKDQELQLVKLEDKVLNTNAGTCLIYNCETHI